MLDSTALGYFCVICCEVGAHLGAYVQKINFYTYDMILNVCYVFSMFVVLEYWWNEKFDNILCCFSFDKIMDNIIQTKHRYVI